VRIAVPPRLHLDVSDTYVYTPPGYRQDSARRYPVAYLIHGTPGESADWVSAGQIGSTMDILIRAGLVPPMIVVAPDMNAPTTIDTECLNAADPGGPQLSTFLNTVVVGYIDAHYPTLADWRHRIIGGFSMGGYCALDQGLRTGEYAAIIDLAGDTAAGSGGHALLPSTVDYLAATPSHYIPTMTLRHRVGVFLDEGGQDAFVGDQLDRVAAQLRDGGQQVVQRAEPGQYHSWTMARVGVAYGLRFASGQLG
jgi:enterochelin esterase-like enzyme